MTPRKAYDDQKRHAQDRGVPWLFSYESWMELWLLSGKWFERGRGPEKYCMCRYGDTGAYIPKNCFIATNADNQKQRWDGRMKVPDDKTNEIINLYLLTDLSQRDVGEIFGVDQSYVSRIVNRKRKMAA